MMSPRSRRRVKQSLDIRFQGTVGPDVLEELLLPIEDVRSDRARICFDLDEMGFAPLDVLVAVLLLLNELAAEGHDVELKWRGANSCRYAERMGFFALLDRGVTVTPSCPAGGLYRTYKDNNPQILEMTAVPAGSDRASATSTLERLHERLTENLAASTGKDPINDLWTFASEALDNIYEHSETPRPGIVAAQRYNSIDRGPRLSLVIADAGLGIPTTIRAGNPSVASMADKDIILAAFRDGLSRRSGKGDGCGLTRCARVAARYEGNVRVRVGQAWTKLVTRSAKMGLTMGFYGEGASIAGTQIGLDLYLDRLERSA